MKKGTPEFYMAITNPGHLVELGQLRGAARTNLAWIIDTIGSDWRQYMAREFGINTDTNQAVEMPEIEVEQSVVTAAAECASEVEVPEPVVQAVIDIFPTGPTHAQMALRNIAKCRQIRRSGTDRIGYIKALDGIPVKNVEVEETVMQSTAERALFWKLPGSFSKEVSLYLIEDACQGQETVAYQSRYLET
jgi:hypothetical protein